MFAAATVPRSHTGEQSFLISGCEIASSGYRPTRKELGRHLGEASYSVLAGKLVWRVLGAYRNPGWDVSDALERVAQPKGFAASGV